MESGVSVAVLAAIDSAESQNTMAVNQAIEAAQQWNAVQNFESGIYEASVQQAGAVACQQADLSCKKIAAEYNGLYAGNIPEMRTGPAEQSNGLGQQVIDYIDQYSQRAKTFSSEPGITKIEQAPLPSATDLTFSSASGLTSSSTSFDPGVAIKLLQRTYEFALETSLISNASNLSTRIFNQLMKEQ